MNRTLHISDFPEILIFNEDPDINVCINLKRKTDGVYVYQFEMESDKKISPKPITLRWRMPAKNIKGVWKPGALYNKRLQYDWELQHLATRISVDAPVIGVIGHDDTNVLTFACADAINLVEMNVLLREEDNYLYCHTTFFAEENPEIQSYQTEIRIDTRKLFFARPLEQVADWWASMDNLKPLPVTALAKAPLYSTWYNFHQDLEEDTILKECSIAAEIGYELIILDDGWQTKDNNRGYDYTGDWQPDRFPDMPGFVEKIHQLGMKFGLWFSVPFCGKHSKAYQRFKGKFLTENHRWAPVFDPRYPEVREYLIGTYVNALKTYNLDAFKLDFIDDFKVYPETVLTKENGRDYANVNEAVDRLLTDVMESLKAIRPEIVIEFRQQYIGPAMRKFGNMFRAFDCPNDAVSNRIRIADVKLLCGDTAVHSDPQTWHFDEPVEIAAFQIINGFFGVPQMSVFLHELPQDHLKMITFYTRYWIEYSEVIMGGQFTPVDPMGNYPLLKVNKDHHSIYGVYSQMIIEIDSDDKQIDLMNGKTSESIVLKTKPTNNQYTVTCWNCMGEVTYQSSINANDSIHELNLEVSGLLRLERIDQT